MSPPRALGALIFYLLVARTANAALYGLVRHADSNCNSPWGIMWLLDESAGCSSGPPFSGLEAAYVDPVIDDLSVYDDGLCTSQGSS